ncbi:MAG: molybdopterin-dependent oxidoreductase [Gammaproteobacteria bacterium]|nr:molybdopterin-dependent oxidoreductase [Gammaproteobacteria bacterium]
MKANFSSSLRQCACTFACKTFGSPPPATWYEKNDFNTSDMRQFIHPLSAAVDPA